MTKILLIGDTHIPSRASRIPPKIESHIISEKYSLILCTGDLVIKDVLLLFNHIGEVKVVKGNMDYLPLPEIEVISLGNIKIGLIHGHQVYPRGDIAKLANIAAKLKVNVLVSGHTHVPSVKKVTIPSREILLLNPGSATGVWSGGGGSLIPSFMELSLIGSLIRITHYELKVDTLTKSHYEFMLTP